MDIFANNIVPQGSYICVNCKNEVVLHKKDYLTPCEKCGGNRFALNAVIELNEEEVEKKFSEITELMITSAFFIESMGMDGFVPVLAQILKLLISNGADALLPRLFPDFTFDRASSVYTDNVLLPEDLFKPGFEQLRFDEFLNQIVIKRDKREDVTIGKIIDTIVEKQGLSVIAPALMEDEYLSCAAGKYYLVATAKYIVRKIGINYEERVNKLVGKIKAL